MNIRLRFSKTVAHAISGRRWHPTQKIKRLPGGAIELQFIAGGKMEILSWILSYGEHVELLEPAELRLELAGKACRLAQLYEPVKSG
jgi:proteasome accessory factor B